MLSGAQLSAGTDNLDGTWTLTPADLAGLTITPPADSDADFTLTVSATSTEADGDAATTLANLDVTVTGVADVPTVDVVAASGGEDQAIALDIGVALGDVDGSETITDITISGVPSGAQLSAGTDNLDGTWTLTPADLAGLTITPAADSDADFTLTVSATSTEAEGDAGTTLANLDVTVTGVVDVPSVTVADAAGAEDTAIALDIGVALERYRWLGIHHRHHGLRRAHWCRAFRRYRQSGRHLDFDARRPGWPNHHSACRFRC